MKKAKCLVILLLTLFCVTTVSAQEPEKAVTHSSQENGRVAMYYEPSTNGRLLAEYFNGVELYIVEHVSDEWVKVDITTLLSAYDAIGFGYVMLKDLAFGSEAAQVEKSTVMYESVNDYFILATHPEGQSGDLGPFGKGEQVELLGIIVPSYAYEEGKVINRPLAYEDWTLHVKIGNTTGFLFDPDVLGDLGQSAATPPSVYGTATVYSPNGGRVHLRDGDSTSAKSLGLYYPGVEVICNTDPDKEWVSVNIGDQMGYMKKEFLYKGNDPGYVVVRTPIMVVNNANSTAWLNLRGKPSLEADVLGKYRNGEIATVLGEVDGWYHVKLDDGNIGYMMPNYLKVLGAVSSTPKPGTATPKPGAGGATTKPGTESSPNMSGGSTHLSASAHMPRGYTVTASVTEGATHERILDVNIFIKYDSQYTANDDIIISYNLYINGKKIANVPAYWDEGNTIAAATTFYADIKYSGAINSAHLIPVSGTDGEYSQETVYLK
jgi:uncharacterized protein YgiM (DUF1202 family)